MIAAAGQQLRLATFSGPGGARTVPVGLDFGAVLAFGTARGVDMALLADVLPEIEAAILSGQDDEGE